MMQVYAITEFSDLPLPGVQGVSLQAHVHKRLAVVYSQRDDRAIRPESENVWQHELIIETLMRDRTTLPARFGTSFTSERELDAALSHRGDRLAECIETVRGCVELGLRALWQPLAPPEPLDTVSSSVATGTGRAYMNARLAREKQFRNAREEATRLASAIHVSLAPLARRSNCRVLPQPARGPEQILAAAYLVERPSLLRFTQRIQDVTADSGPLRLLCTGPWPPYNFVPALQNGETLHA